MFWKNWPKWTPKWSKNQWKMWILHFQWKIVYYLILYVEFEYEVIFWTFWRWKSPWEMDLNLSKLCPENTPKIFNLYENLKALPWTVDYKSVDWTILKNSMRNRIGSHMYNNGQKATQKLLMKHFELWNLDCPFWICFFFKFHDSIRTKMCPKWLKSKMFQC